MGNKVKKVGLALGGGGARGFCHIGVVEVLQENGIPIDVVTGCSMGAMIGGGVAAGVPIEQARKMAVAVNQQAVFDIEIRHLFAEGLAAGKKAMKTYKKLVGEKLIEDCSIKFAAIATDLVSSKLHVITSGTIWQAVRASVAIPGVFHPVKEDGRVLVDGGVLKRIPIEEVRELGADIVIAVDALGAPHDKPELKSVFDIIEMSYLIMDWKMAEKERKAAELLIVPEMGNKTVYEFKNNQEAIDAGRKAATDALPKIFELLKKNKIERR
ncbi:MAG: patatin-like phospholipase family protein [Firmicutes bacterium]|nr:patatin-like phospholipase family protein [Bacillota bacterium]